MKSIRTYIHITEEGRGGGPLHTIVDTAMVWLSQKRPCLVICPKEPQGFTHQLGQKSIPFRATHLHVLSRQWKKLLVYLLTFPYQVILLITILRQYSSAVVIAHGAAQVKGIIAAKLSHQSVVWIMHDTAQPKSVIALYSFFSSMVDGIIFTSAKSQEYYINKCPRTKHIPQTVIPSPIDLSHFNIKQSNFSFAPKDHFTILTVCYINPHKGIELLIEAAHAMRQSGYNDIHFYIVGKVLDTQQQYYNQLIAKRNDLQLQNIHFLGHKNNIVEYLKAADIYLCTSVRESSPIALWEALACGKRIITTDVGDVSRLINKSEDFIIIPQGQLQKLTKAIKDLYHDIQNTNNTTSVNNRTQAVKLFGRKHIAHQYSAFINHL